MLLYSFRNRSRQIKNTYSLVLIFCILNCYLLPICAINAQEKIYDGNNQLINIDACLKNAEKQIKLGDYKEASRNINTIAEGFWNGKNYPKAIEYYKRSILLNEKIENESGIASISNNLGMIYADIYEYENSLQYFNTAIALRKKLKETSGLISAYINASVVLNNLKRYNKSIENLEQALLLATELSDTDRMKSCYGMLAETYEKIGNSEKMLEYYNLYKTFHELVERDKRQSVLEQAKASELKAQYMEAQKKIKELELLSAWERINEQNRIISQKDTIYIHLMDKYSKSELANNFIRIILQKKDLEAKQSNEALEKEKLFVQILTVAVSIVCILLFLLLYNFQQKRKAHKQLRVQNIEINKQHDEILQQQNELEKYFNIICQRNENITSSINYAKLIQQAVLGKKEKLSQLFNESFIFFEPKDIVSGDFYWFKQINGLSLLAVADCTGHGVPGAFMSMLGINLINQIVNQRTLEVNQILKQLSIGVIKALNASQSDNRIGRDGMDIALIGIDMKEEIATFSGAKHSIFYIQNNQLNEIKGDRTSIGNIGSNRNSRGIEFTKHQFKISEPTSIYAFSDGIIDQFNESDDKKFLKRRLRKLLLDIHHKPAIEQKNILIDTFSKWKGKQTQTDDVIVVGVNLQSKN